MKSLYKNNDIVLLENAGELYLCVGSSPAKALAELPAETKLLAQAILEQAKTIHALNEAGCKLVNGLELYAAPSFYHGCAFMFDRPTGGFDEDFDFDSTYDRDMPGRAARAAMAEAMAVVSAAGLQTNCDSCE